VDVNVRRLKYFLAVADQRHFGRAAELLYISPTALSEQVRKLEGELGLRLFDRNPRGAMPTEAGQRLIPAARALLAQSEAIGRIVETSRRRTASVLTLGFVALAAGEATSVLVSEFERRSAGSRVELVYLPFPRQTAAVRSGEVDVSIARGPISEAGLRTQTIGREPRMAMLSASHPLAKQRSVSCAQLAREVRVNMQGVPAAWRKWWSLDRSPAVRAVPYGPYITSFDEQLEIAASNQAISIVPACAARMHQRSDIAFVLIDDAEQSEILLCAREDDDSRTVETLFSAAAAVAERGHARR
jgi:DNA-binding transcriptional LysR family regulator